MKKVLGFLMALAAVALLSVGCHKVVRGDATGLVDEITDSVMIVRIDGSKVKFDITECAFTNGSVMYGDSVIISYVGDLSASYSVAETCYLIVKPSPTVEVGVVDTTKELKTRPADPERRKEVSKMLDVLKKSQKN